MQQQSCLTHKETEVASPISTYKPSPNKWLLQACQHLKGVTLFVYTSNYLLYVTIEGQ